MRSGTLVNLKMRTAYTLIARTLARYSQDGWLSMKKFLHEIPKIEFQSVVQSRREVREFLNGPA